MVSVSFTDDGTRMLSISEDQTARIWDTRSGSQIGVFRAPGIDFYSVALFSPSGNYFATPDGIEWMLRDASSGEAVFKISSSEAFSFMPTGDGFMTIGDDPLLRDATASSAWQIRFYDLESRALVSRTSFQLGDRLGVRRLWMAAGAETILWVDDGYDLNAMKIGDLSVRHIESMPTTGSGWTGGTRLTPFTARASDSGTPSFAYELGPGFRLLDVQTTKTQAYGFEGQRVDGIEYVGDDLYVFMRREGWQTVDIHVVKDGSVRRLRTLEADQPIQVSPDGGYVAYKGSDVNTIMVEELATGTLIGEVSSAVPFRALKFSPDSKYLITQEVPPERRSPLYTLPGERRGTVLRLRRLDGFSEVGQRRVVGSFRDSVTDVVVHPTDGYLALLDRREDEIVLLNLDSGGVRTVVQLSGRPIDRMYFSADGAQLVGLSSQGGDGLEYVIWQRGRGDGVSA